jgi:hypothetical protein
MLTSELTKGTKFLLWTGATLEVMNISKLRNGAYRLTYKNLSNGYVGVTEETAESYFEVTAN